MGLRGSTTKFLPASGNSRNESPLIASIILSQHTWVLRRIIYLPLMSSITKELCIPVGASSITGILLRNTDISIISEITIANAPTTAIGHTDSKEVESEVGRYNRAARGYRYRRLPNGKICTKRSLWYCHEYSIRFLEEELIL